MSDLTLEELAEAELVPNQGGSNAWLVRVGEGQYEMVNKSGKNTLLVKGDVNVQDSVSYGGITVDFDLENNDIILDDGDNEVDVPSEKHENVLWAVYECDGPRLQKLFDELYTPTVRVGLMDQFMPRFRTDSEAIRKTDDGWLVNGDILVSWDGSNHAANVEEVHTVTGSTTSKVETNDVEAREIRMPSGWTETDAFTAMAPDGRTFEIDEVELKFLTTVGLIVGRNHGAKQLYDDDLSHTIGNAEIIGFTDTLSGLRHNHSTDKHRIQDLGVTDECADMLWSNANDHTPLTEMALREQELKNAPIDLFENARNDDASKWQKIHSTKEKAPIPKHIRKQLEEQFE